MFSKLLKILAALLGLAVLVVAGVLCYLKFALPKAAPAPALVIHATPELIARGRYLANHVAVCIDCHSERDWSRFSAPLVPGTEGRGGESFDHRFGFPGAFTAKNITPASVGAWTDGELYRAITTGVSRDGHALFPIMPYLNYGHMADEDVRAIIAYIRTLAPINHAVPPSRADFPVNFLVNTMPAPAAPQPLPDPADTVAQGRYLVTVAGCAMCHTREEHGKPVGARLAGGFAFDVGQGHIVRSANLTPDDTGIKAMTRGEFIARFQHYRDPTNLGPVDMAKGGFQTVMPWSMFAGMTDADLGAIYDYLRTVPPVPNVVERWSTAH
ncbi:cytochrome c [Horticoccus luteus]|uniref:Cytochrome c n=1 Tax=Horticoccus luteus TaxID=2862869 RepID=A0A8F9TWA3_9BACT|nr:c-type cytochrome [Horticoccus luteus]QYM78933.1 cytochrome c [Horticoccus luteus]